MSLVNYVCQVLYLFMLVGHIRLRKSDSVGYIRGSPEKVRCKPMNFLLTSTARKNLTKV